MLHVNIFHKRTQVICKELFMIARNAHILRMIRIGIGICAENHSPQRKVKKCKNSKDLHIEKDSAKIP